MRRNIKRSALVQLAYICVRTLWHSVPYLTGGAPPAAAASALLPLPCCLHTQQHAPAATRSYWARLYEYVCTWLLFPLLAVCPHTHQQPLPLPLSLPDPPTHPPTPIPRDPLQRSP